MYKYWIVWIVCICGFLGLEKSIAQPQTTQKIFEDILACKKNDDTAISLAIHKLYEAYKKDPEFIQYFRQLLNQKERLDIQKNVIDYFRAIIERPERKEVIQDALQLFPQILVFLNGNASKHPLRKVSQQFLQEIRKQIALHSELIRLILSLKPTLEERISAIYVFRSESQWSKETLQTLIEFLLKSPEEEIRKSLMLLLEYWTGYTFQEPREWKEWWDQRQSMDILTLKEEIIRQKNHQLETIRENQSQQVTLLIEEKEKQFETILIDLFTLKAYPEQFLKILSFSSPRIRKFAVEKLGATRAVIAVDPLIGLLVDPSSEVRSASIQALIKIKEVKALDPLTELLKDPKLSVSDTQIILEGLKVFKTTETTSKILQVLLGFLKSPLSVIRSTAILELGNLGESSAIPDLIEIFKTDLLPEVQEACVKSLGNLKAKDAVSWIIQIGLNNKENSLRWHSIDALGRIGDPQALAPLKQQFQNETVPLVQAVILSSLGLLRDYESLSLFKQILNGNYDKLIRQKAAGSFYQLISGKETSEDFIPLLNALKDPESSIAEAVWISLENILQSYPKFFKPIEEYLYQEAFKHERLFELKQRIFFISCNRILLLYEQKQSQSDIDLQHLLLKARCEYYLEANNLQTYSKVFNLKPPPDEQLSLELEYIDILLNNKNIDEAMRRLNNLPEIPSASPFFWWRRYLGARIRFLQKDIEGAKKELDLNDSSAQSMDPYLLYKCKLFLQQLPE
ncbi:MAG: HEAT repeat domain-containing protein [Planctomycetota bacterium]